MPSKRPAITVRLSKETHTAIAKAAKADGRTSSGWLRHLAEKALGLLPKR